MRYAVTIYIALGYLTSFRISALIPLFSRTAGSSVRSRSGCTRRSFEANCVTVDQPEIPLVTAQPDTDMSKDRLQTDKTNQGSIFSKLVKLLSPGDGQSYGNRSALHAINAKRKFSDPQMWTHIFFVINGIAAFQYKVYDLLLLTSITAPLSFVYHYSYEKPGKLAKFEGSAAKALFAYGVAQIFHAPSHPIMLVELLMLFLTVLIFISTNLKPQLYESYHCYMHVIPPIWATIVALKHTPLIKLF